MIIILLNLHGLVLCAPRLRGDEGFWQFLNLSSMSLILLDRSSVSLPAIITYRRDLNNKQIYVFAFTSFSSVSELNFLYCKTGNIVSSALNLFYMSSLKFKQNCQKLEKYLYEMFQNKLNTNTFLSRKFTGKNMSMMTLQITTCESRDLIMWS